MSSCSPMVSFDYSYRSLSIQTYLLRLVIFWTWLLCGTSLPSTVLSQTVSSGWVAGPEIGGINFPDPSLIEVNETWVSFATRTRGSSVHIQAAISTDFATWSLVFNADGSQFDALPSLPPWVNPYFSNTWAPDVSLLADGSYVMYFSATTAENRSQHCIGAAFSENILGPYTAQDDPLFCPLAQGGAIDPAAYSENGQNYVVFKIDGNSMGHGGACGNAVPPYVPTPLVIQAVGADGVTLQGLAVELLDNSGAPDQGVIEAPSLVKVGLTYVLFFSSGCFASGHYTVSYATSTSLVGPYTRASAPLFKTGEYGLYAPGGASVASDGVHIVFHAGFGNGRALFESAIEIDGSAGYQNQRRLIIVTQQIGQDLPG